MRRHDYTARSSVFQRLLNRGRVNRSPGPRQTQESPQSPDRSAGPSSYYRNKVSYRRSRSRSPSQSPPPTGAAPRKKILSSVVQIRKIESIIKSNNETLAPPKKRVASAVVKINQQPNKSRSLADKPSKLLLKAVSEANADVFKKTESEKMNVEKKVERRLQLLDNLNKPNSSVGEVLPGSAPTAASSSSSRSNTRNPVHPPAREIIRFDEKPPPQQQQRPSRSSTATRRSVLERLGKRVHSGPAGLLLSSIHDRLGIRRGLGGSSNATSTTRFENIIVRVDSGGPYDDDGFDDDDEDRSGTNRSLHPAGDNEDEEEEESYDPEDSGGGLARRHVHHRHHVPEYGSNELEDSVFGGETLVFYSTFVETQRSTLITFFD